MSGSSIKSMHPSMQTIRLAYMERLKLLRCHQTHILIPHREDYG